MNTLFYTILGYVWQYVTNPKVMMALSFFVVIISMKNTVSDHVFWMLVAVYILILVVWGIYALIQHYRHGKKGEELSEAIASTTEAEQNRNKNKEELQLIQQQMKESIQLIRKSRLGDRKGNTALYELPWYMVIGNPAAGKSSAIYHSGLRFPFEEHHQQMVSSGLSGTRNCDWFFSTEGVLLDTAGRYSVYAEDHSEWLGFLNILKKNRSKAPVNGLIVIVSIAELVSQSPEKSIKLAKNLRARIQDLTERLEVFAPVYLVFSKMDLIAGFTDFFDCYDAQEFDQVWGATLPYAANSSEQALELFEEHYNILYDGLKSVSTTHLSRRHSQHISPSVMTFPLEFKSLKPVLKTFISTLFQENPYQFKPIFRGFYFTSALQDGVIESPMTEQIADDFHLIHSDDSELGLPKQSVSQNHGYFLKGLFSNVILKDKHLVRQHINPTKKRQRFMAFTGAILGVSIVLSLWLWSYRNNQQLITEVQADLNKVLQIQAQANRSLNHQLDALLILQGHLQQLDQFDQDRPLKYSFGLYQGKQIREKLETEYLKGIEQLVLQPTQQQIAQYLQRVKANEAVLKENYIQVKMNHVAQGRQIASEPSDQNPQDAYNALKTYLMLSNRQYMDSSHLSDQLTRFWRTWLEQNRGEIPRGEMLQKAEQILGYAITLSGRNSFPQLNSDAVLVDQTRQILTAITTGISARDRVYNEIKSRAAVRFPAMTVKQILGETNQNAMLGSYALPGIYTYPAWKGYVQEAIEQAASSTTDSRDWVLNTTQSDDLSFSGSPEQIRRQLTELYKKEYIAEWRKFLNAIHYAKAGDFNQQIKQMDLLGEPEHSPIRILIQRVAQETSWDNPMVQAELAVPQKGFIAWFKRKVLNRDEAKQVQQANSPLQHGVIAREFQMFYQMVRQRDDLQNQSLLDGYMQSMAKIRSQYNDLKSSGDIGPASMALVKQTIHEQNSIFNTSQKFVAEKMAAGTTELDQQLLQKLLVAPLIQSFEGLLVPAQAEINKLWTMQSYQPFSQNLAQKYPFSSQATLQATSNEINQIFGESGSIARFVKEHLDPLVIRRGYTLTSKTWQDLGISLNPAFVANFQTYVAPAHGVATGELTQGQGTAPAVNQSNFQFYPLENPQLLAYTFDIDGQRMLFENGIQQWVNFVWPNPGAIPGTRITLVDLEGKTHTIFDEPGEYGINRLIESAQRTQKGSNFEMVWKSKENPELWVKVNFRLVSGQNASSIGGQPNYANLQLVDQVVSNKSVRVVAAQSVPVSAQQSLAQTNPATALANTGVAAP
ncbi:type VI secretion protein IcmF [Acinetobacter schindleri NIPH 900]|uniref:Type VI secretion protein IcmF n=1 Tax=Acinetobacter schindleri NIPH 900 TaxID=1217675 RepID=N8WJT0_9GAMM|nr:MULTISPECIES: type VI secretion system membrane subunit TssM [Acinetobacter]ENV12342.1 type VI secretion protein IcmF [Acinetobacter schindleri NIPH 900]MBB4834885.1 type VI secretion system protein ImpL [Acinetobacter schindleri]RAZ03185.1 type VI secretion system membrane subunit TssM [Acinetobacter sp. SM1B]WBX39604.1 type VI secretion system membrane subunit TssM [Acinetobacter schindleri]